jgi:eukaryotic-like serine/threonine-protein kinase
MALAAGARLGPYEVLSPLGSGGMGEVYRARDTKLNRDVALKVLPEAFALDADRLARFKREAQVLASLNHPNIAAIYGFEESDGIVQALVLELVEGPTLADRIAQGPTPLDDALPLARQIAEALEAAHEQGIIHRDLKPANIKLRPDGTVKVLDFGLAKALEPAAALGADVTASPTITSPAMTRMGTILGTAAYMSPEQAKGHAADKRSDVWAFGCVLLEMLTGRSPFTRGTISETVAAILEREPDWAALPVATPVPVRRLLERCLAKDPKRRLRDVGDARLEIDEAIASPAGAAAPRADRTSRLTAVRWALALVGTVAATSVVVWNVKPTPSAPSTSVARFAITPPPSDPLAVDLASVAISPDGRRVAYAAGRGGRQRIFLRAIDDFGGAPVPGTEGGRNPFFSPDGEWLGFFIPGKMKKVPRAGGTPLVICDTPGTVGATPSWETDGTIFFAPTIGTSIWRVSAAGGVPAAVTTLTETETSHRWPQLLSDGKALLFGAISASAEAQVYVQSLDTGQRRLVAKGAGARYLPTGHLVYVQGGTVMAVPFDPVRLEVSGTPVAVLSGVVQLRRLRNSTAVTLLPQISFSTTGPMVYVPGNERPRQDALVWVDRSGSEAPTGASGGTYFQPRLSQDGSRMAVTVGGGDHDDVWLYDLVRKTWSRFTSEGNNGFPLWTPDGRALTYVSDKAGPDNIYSKPLDGSGPGERVLASARPNYPFSWSRDGALAFVSMSPTTQQDLWILRPDQKGKPKPFLTTPFGEGAPVFSPDGRWLAYVSNESGRTEIYVRPFPGPGEALTISTDGGNEPVWSATGRELFYRSGDAMMAVGITTSPAFAVGKPRPLFEKPFESSFTFWPDYDVTPDGQRFVMVKRIDQDEAPAQINVMLNWLDELKRRVPTK